MRLCDCLRVGPANFRQSIQTVAQMSIDHQGVVPTSASDVGSIASYSQALDFMVLNNLARRGQEGAVLTASAMDTFIELKDITLVSRQRQDAAQRCDDSASTIELRCCLLRAGWTLSLQANTLTKHCLRIQGKGYFALLIWADMHAPSGTLELLAALDHSQHGSYCRCLRIALGLGVGLGMDDVPLRQTVKFYGLLASFLAGEADSKDPRLDLKLKTKRRRTASSRDPLLQPPA